MFLLEVERIEAQLKEVEGKYHIADEESKEASQSYENIKSEYEKLEQDMASMDDKIASIREEMSQSTVTKGKLEGQINVLNEQIHTAEMTDEHLKSRLDSIDREKQERIESRGTYEAEKQELDTELVAAATEKETAAEQLRVMVTYTRAMGVCLAAAMVSAVLAAFYIPCRPAAETAIIICLAAMATNAAAAVVSVYRRRDRSKTTRLRILNFRPKI